MRKVAPTKSWRNPKQHYLNVLSSEWYRIISDLQHEFIKLTIDFYETTDYRFMMFPVTTGTISSPMGLGSDSMPVRINLQGQDTYLADSMQFFLEFACRLNKKGSYYIAPSFRGELADKRHLCQFYHSEAEIVGDLNDVINLSEEYLKYLAHHFVKNCENEIKRIAGSDISHITNIIENRLQTCTLDEAISRLGNNKYLREVDGAISINSEGETELMRQFGGAVWLTHFDHKSVPFYQAYDPTDNRKALNADLLIGIGETIGAGQRHRTGQEVRAALDAHAISYHEYEWYINLKKHTNLQTSGFGMGVERFLLWLLKHDDIRDLQILPRFNGEPIEF